MYIKYNTFINSIQSCYDIVTKNRMELSPQPQKVSNYSAEDFDEEEVLRVGVADADAVRRRIRDVHDAANALARDEVRAVQAKIDLDLARRGKRHAGDKGGQKKGGKQDGRNRGA